MARTEYKNLERLLKAEGYVEVKTRGGHRQFKHPIYRNKISLTINVKKNIELSVRRQIKQAKERFENENQGRQRRI